MSLNGVVVGEFRECSTNSFFGGEGIWAEDSKWIWLNPSCPLIDNRRYCKSKLTISRSISSSQNVKVKLCKTFITFKGSVLSWLISCKSEIFTGTRKHDPNDWPTKLGWPSLKCPRKIGRVPITKETLENVGDGCESTTFTSCHRYGTSLVIFNNFVFACSILWDLKLHSWLQLTRLEN